ncbi:MAG: right-handed parallel beta-helix repeat-containing protein, partial [Bacteroidales bacterium]|nr:right-handed parallel beta-helix repeat-containing protein [Bacteroidales bacterium]
MKHIFSFLIAICCFSFVFSNTYTVTTTADTGAGSLRQAITNANSSFSGGHTICFDIPFTDSGYDSASGTFTIHLQSELPYFLIVNNITIDGTSQAANKGNTNPLGPEVVLTCDTLNLMSCFRVASAGITIKGFVIGGFQYAVLLFGANRCTVSDCYIGTAPDGRAPFPNTYGIGLSGGTYGTINLGYARNAVISNNVISGNTSAGIVMEGSGTRNNVVKGNRIGVSALGDSALSNHYGIIIMTNANSNRIGGTTAAERNIISANDEIGIYIESADSNVVCGNYIGLDATGTYTFEFAPDSSIQANGVEINTTGRHNIIGGNTPQERNIISGNRVYGCIYYGNCSQNNICGNYI